MKRYQGIAVALGLLLLLGIVGRMDCEDQAAELANYCEMVKAGHWPDYQGVYRRECSTPTPAQH